MESKPEHVDEPRDPTITAVIDQVRRLAVDSEAYTRSFSDRHALHPTDARAVVVLVEGAARGHEVTPGTLRTALGLTSASVTALVDRLERAGHVERTRGAGDRRRVLLVPSARIRRLGAEHFGALDRRMRADLAALDPADVAAALRVLDVIAGAVAAELRQEAGVAEDG